MNPSKEDLRQAWASTVADANLAADALDEAVSSESSQEEVRQRVEDLADANLAVDEAYRAYLDAVNDWAGGAPLRSNVIVMPSVAAIGTGFLPALTFSFRHVNDQPITVTLVASEQVLRRFQRDLDKTVTAAVREVRARL